MKNKTGDIDAYLERLGNGQRAALEMLRSVIKAAAPEAEEAFSYGLPAFRIHGRVLAAYGAAKTHLSFYPMSPAVIKDHEADIGDFKTSKGTIRFQPDHPLSASLIRKLISARMEEICRSALPVSGKLRR